MLKTQLQLQPLLALRSGRFKLVLMQKGYSKPRAVSSMLNSQTVDYQGLALPLSSALSLALILIIIIPARSLGPDKRP